MQVYRLLMWTRMCEDNMQPTAIECNQSACIHACIYPCTHPCIHKSPTGLDKEEARRMLRHFPGLLMYATKTLEAKHKVLVEYMQTGALWLCCTVPVALEDTLPCNVECTPVHLYTLECTPVHTYHLYHTHRFALCSHISLLFRLLT